MSGLRPLDADLFVAEQPLRFLGVEIGARMTVVRLAGGRLLLHSPIRPTAALADEVRGLGTPTWLVAPNRFHHVFVGDWAEQFPGAALYAAPGVAEKRPDLAVSGVLGDAAPAELAGELDCALLAGFPLANEVVFHHPASATLIASDLAFNLGPESPPLTRLLARLGGFQGRLATSALERLGIRDRRAYRQSLERVLAWPFERLVVAHGSVLERDAREALRQAYAWLPPLPVAGDR